MGKPPKCQTAPDGLPRTTSFTRDAIVTGDGQRWLPTSRYPTTASLPSRQGPDNDGGVYRCGFAGSQQAYDSAYDRLFTALDWVSDRLDNQRYLVGDTITEADVRLFTTLARFDPVYHGHFKCNRSKLSEMPVLWAYARDLFQTPGFGDTIDFVQIKQHYYIVHADINPTRIVPKGSGTGELVDTTWSGSVGRPTFRRWHATWSDARE